MTTKRVCEQCGWNGFECNVPTAANPFKPHELINGCPKCRSINTIRVACDEPSCWERVECGTPTPAGYRTLVASTPRKPPNPMSTTNPESPVAANWQVNGNAIHDMKSPTYGECVAVFVGPDRHEHARFVLHRVNAFDALVVALDEMLKYFAIASAYPEFELDKKLFVEMSVVETRARAALAAAKQQP